MIVAPHTLETTTWEGSLALNGKSTSYEVLNLNVTHSFYAIVIELSSVSQKEVQHKVLMDHTFTEQLQNSLVMPSRRAFYRNLMQRV